MEYNYISLLKIFLATILIQATYCKVYHKNGVDKAFFLVKFSDEFKDSDSLVFYYQYNPESNEMIPNTRCHCDQSPAIDQTTAFRVKQKVMKTGLLFVFLRHMVLT